MIVFEKLQKRCVPIPTQVPVRLELLRCQGKHLLLLSERP